MWFFGSKKASSSSSSFSWSSTAEEVTHGVNGTGLTAIVTGLIQLIINDCLCVLCSLQKCLIKYISCTILISTYL